MAAPAATRGRPAAGLAATEQHQQPRQAAEDGPRSEVDGVAQPGEEPDAQASASGELILRPEPARPARPPGPWSWPGAGCGYSPAGNKPRPWCKVRDCPPAANADAAAGPGVCPDERHTRRPERRPGRRTPGPWPGKTRPGTAARSSRSASPGEQYSPPGTGRAAVTCRSRNGRRSRVCRESQPWRRACKEKAGRPRQEARPRRSSAVDGPGVIIDQAFHRGQPAAVVPGSRLVAAPSQATAKASMIIAHPSDPKSAKPASSAPSDRR